MKLTSIIDQYKIQDTACSSPQLVIMLLDGCIRYARDAAAHLRQNNWAEKGKAVEAVQTCLIELRNGLNREDKNEIVEHLDRMYDFLSTKMTYGNLSKDPLQFEQVADALQGVRDAWQLLFERLKADGALAETAV
jgi:flagellar biosynthetic protein FliS